MGTVGAVGTRGEKVPVVDISEEDPVVEEPAVEEPVETPEVEAEVEEETVDDVPVEVADEELSAGSVTLNCWDWARMPVFFSEVDIRLTWKPELRYALVEYFARGCRVDLPLGDILEARGSVAALGGVDVGGNLLLNGGVDGVVDQDDVDSVGIGAVWD